MQNEALVLNKVKDMKLQPFPNPEVGPADVLVEVKRVGICGSDVHYWQHGRIGDFICKEPMVLGHETAGQVVRVGRDVKNLKPGDRIALEPGVPCDKCKQCTCGKYNLCPDIKFFATPSPPGNPGHGSLARYVSHPARFCFKLPDNVTLEEGAFCEPLSVGVYACQQKANVQRGDAIAIFGAGPIGTICALVANGMGAGRLILCDIQEPRLDFVKGMIPSLCTINTGGMSPDEVAAQILKANGGQHVDGAIDCAGVEQVISAAIKATKPGGTVCLVGMGKPDMTLPILDASIREVCLDGVFRYRNTYPTCIDLLSSKKVNLDPLLTHRFTFDQASLEDAFETCRTGKGKDGKTAIKCMISIEPKA